MRVLQRVRNLACYNRLSIQLALFARKYELERVLEVFIIFSPQRTKTRLFLDRPPWRGGKAFLRFALCFHLNRRAHSHIVRLSLAILNVRAEVCIHKRCAFAGFAPAGHRTRPHAPCRAFAAVDNAFKAASSIE